MTVDRVNGRKAFGRNISEFGLVRDKIAQMCSEIFALESMTYLTTGLVDAGSSDFTVESAICKVFGSETGWRVANEAQQIAGALGYMRAQPWERLLRDARIPMVYEGTNEILRCFIALSGMQGPGREIEEVAKAMREPIKGFGLLSDFAIRKARSALGRERFSKAHPMLAREAVLFEEYTGHLAKGVDKVLRRHGKNIAEMQYTQKRIADLAIDLYAIATVIARTTRSIERRGEEGSRREIDLASVFVASAKRRMAENVLAMDENDDELRKSIAQRTCTDGGYPLDVI
jgi:acyl-CoA dehydrogenase family protein 9